MGQGRENARIFLKENKDIRDKLETPCGRSSKFRFRAIRMRLCRLERPRGSCACGKAAHEGHRGSGGRRRVQTRPARLTATVRS